MNPSCANGTLGLLGENVFVTCSTCGPGYTYSITGYFRFASKSNGLYITPYRSVTPSSAFTRNVSGYLKPASINCDTSVVSSSASCVPCPSSNTDFGAVSTLEYV